MLEPMPQEPSNMLDLYLKEIRNPESPTEQVELKINRKLGKNELMGLKTQIKYATEEMVSMNAILDEYKRFMKIKVRI